MSIKKYIRAIRNVLNNYIKYKDKEMLKSYNETAKDCISEYFKNKGIKN